MSRNLKTGKMNRKWWIGYGIMILCMMLLGCRCNNKDKAKENWEDTLNARETADSFSMESIKQRDSIIIFRNDSITKVLDHLSIQKASWTDAHLMDIDTVAVNTKREKVTINDAFLKKYASVLKMSPDGQNVLDFGSDNMIEDNGTLVSREPETNIYIDNTVTGERTLLRQLGASGEVVHAYWVDNQKIAILSTLPGKNPKKDDTYLNVYDVKSKVMKTYRWK